MDLDLLFRPGRIGSLELKNRLIMAAMGIGHCCDEDNHPTDRLVAFLEARAKGGVGLVVTGGAAVAPEGRSPHGLVLYHNRFVAPLRDLVSTVHAAGAKIACQLGHLGVLVDSAWRGLGRPADVRAVGPTAINVAAAGVTPHAMTVDEIRATVVGYGDAALRAREAGFDAVEINAAHGHFLSAFLSPFKNRRDDEYGGSPRNRARFVIEAVARCKDRAGSDFPVVVKINGSDFFPGGTTLENMVELAPRIVDAGADALTISAGALESAQWKNLNYLHPDGALLPLSEAIKNVVNVPVIAVGKLGDPSIANDALREGKADFVAMARALLADPDLPNKAKAGHLDQINYCIYCNNCRPNYRALDGWRLGCTQNPALLREREFALPPIGRKRRVMVVGGGLAGMEAAAVLAQRGHDVTLYERAPELGGQWNIAKLLPSKDRFVAVTDSLRRSLAKYAVPIVLRTAVDRDLVQQVKPDAVVIATGALPAPLQLAWLAA